MRRSAVQYPGKSRECAWITALYGYFVPVNRVLIIGPKQN
jgi:hypothetical protein